MDLKNKFISASIVAALSFVVSLSVTLYSERTPELTYEYFSTTSFTINQGKRNLLNYRIDNNGRKEAEKVEVALKYKNGMIVKDFSINLSSEAIEYEVVERKTNGIKVIFPILNPTESATFSFVTLNEKGYIDIGLRAKGEVGREKGRKNIQRNEFKFLILYGVVICFFTMGMVFFLLFLLTPNEKKMHLTLLIFFYGTFVQKVLDSFSAI